MLKNDFSYWLTISGNPERLEKADKMARRLPEDYLVPDIDGDIPTSQLRYCVDPSSGTLEEWTDAEDTISKLAKAFPDLVISLECMDEEDAVCSHNHVWHAGKSASAYGSLDIPDTQDLLVKIEQGDEAYEQWMAIKHLNALISKTESDETKSILEQAKEKIEASFL